MSMSDPVAVLDEYLSGVEAGDFDRVRSCLADQFSYRGPLRQFDDPDAFIANIWHFGQILHRIERRKMFADGHHACGILNFHIHLHERRTIPIVLWVKVEEGKIASMESFFDSADYARLFEA